MNGEQVIQILVCDDDPDARNLIGATLGALNYEIIEAKDGLHAKELCEQHLPDVIVLDVMMPRMTGLEFLQWFRTAVTDPFVPVLLLTALDQVENRVEGLTSGADDYLTKPFHFKELQARVQALLRIKELTQRLRERSEILEQVNQELKAAQDRLVQHEKQVTAGELAGATAHSLGQPLTSILLHLFVLERYLACSATEREAMTAEASSALKIIREQATRMKEILGDLQHVDASKREHYVGELNILEIAKRGK